MKKSLLAFAILGAFASVASAQSSVTIYGLIDTGFASIDQGGPNNKTNGIFSGNNGASRIGFKGIEDLGNGLKAEFVLENGINTDNGSFGSTGFAFSRLSFVGLNGSYGKFRLGRQNTQVKEMLGEIDPFGAAGIVNSVDFINGGGLDQRNPNQVAWLSNNYGGFSGGVAYQFGEQNTGTSDGSGYSARLGYENGPLNIQFAYQKANAAAALPVYGDQNNTLLGATYDFGALKLHGIYGHKTTDAAFSGNATDAKLDSALVGVTVPFGSSAVRAEYIRNDVKNSNTLDNSAWALSYTYAMSKRTTMYATYVATSNDSGSDLGIGGPGEAAVGQNARGIAVGIAHKF